MFRQLQKKSTLRCDAILRGESLLGRALAVAADAEVIDAEALASLPVDLVQLYVDLLCLQQRPQQLSAVLSILAKDVGTAHALHRIALRSVDVRSPSLIAWRVDDAFMAPLPKFGALETLELGSCYQITDEPLAACLRAMPRLAAKVRALTAALTTKKTSNQA